MNYSKEVEEMCIVAKGPKHGPAPIPEEGKWVQAKEVKDISGYTHGVGWCAPQQGACKLSLNVKDGIIEEALVETVGCSGMTHSAAMAAEILPGKTIMEALGGKKTLSEVRNIGALAAGYPFVLYSDLYDHRDFIRGVAQSSFSGILWTPEVRDAKSKEELIRRIQAVVFSCQCLINAWYCDRVPWADLDCEDEVRELLKLRESLVPMLKEAFDKYRDTGKPPIRALVMDYSDDSETYRIDDEYIFCDELLVAPIAAGHGDERDVYLPTSERWVDYFTGEEVGSGKIHVSTAGIPVYRKVR